MPSQAVLPGGKAVHAPYHGPLLRLECRQPTKRKAALPAGERWGRRGNSCSTQAATLEAAAATLPRPRCCPPVKRKRPPTGSRGCQLNMDATPHMDAARQTRTTPCRFRITATGASGARRRRPRRAAKEKAAQACEGEGRPVRGSMTAAHRWAAVDILSRRRANCHR